MTDKKTKALKLAQEALEDVRGGQNYDCDTDQCDEAISAIREALEEQPAQQDSTCNNTLRAQGKAYPRTCKKCGFGPCIADRVQPAQQECRTDGRCQYAIDSGAEGMGHCPKGKCVMPAQQQEPVAWMDADGDLYKDEPKENWCPPHTQLYTFPQPSKPWVGLTDEEVDDLSREMVKGNKSVNWLARAIEAKLKEKNT